MNAQTTAKQTSKMSQIGKTRYMVQVAMLGAFFVAGTHVLRHKGRGGNARRRRSRIDVF